MRRRPAMNFCACDSVGTRAGAQTNRGRRICSSCTPGRLIVRMSHPPYAGPMGMGDGGQGAALRTGPQATAGVGRLSPAVDGLVAVDPRRADDRFAVTLQVYRMTHSSVAV